ncbi:MAG: flippase-like domain-containing protein [Planctomycetes bacterium]|nr:flippase-like domain-containing protein [Planctomycetota bacterium]
MAVTTAILGFLFSRVDLTGWAATLYESLSVWLVVALVSTGLMVIVSTYKWHVLLHGLGIVVNGWTLLRLYLIGLFVSACLPGIVGGDVVRWHMAGNVTGKRLKVGATILAERALGVVSLVILCLLVVAFGWQRFATRPILALCGGITVVAVGGMAIALNRRLIVNLRFRTRRSLLGRCTRLAYHLNRTFREFPRRSILVALAHSFLFYLCGGVALFYICVAFSVDISLVEAITIQSLICLLLLIPISLGGLGLTQAGDVYLFSLIGVSPDIALGISIVRLILYYTYALPGGIAFMQRRQRNAAGISDWSADRDIEVTSPELSADSRVRQ